MDLGCCDLVEARALSPEPDADTGPESAGAARPLLGLVHRDGQQAEIAAPRAIDHAAD